MNQDELHPQMELLNSSHLEEEEEVHPKEGSRITANGLKQLSRV